MSRPPIQILPMHALGVRLPGSLPPVALRSLACALALAFAHGMAGAAEVIRIQPGQSLDLRRVQQAAGGQDAESGLFTDTYATAGQQPAGFDVENLGTLLASRLITDGMVRLESNGGRGGHGVGALVPQAGGQGGAVDLVNRGGIDIGGSPSVGTTPTDLIRLASRGGQGGDATRVAPILVKHGPADGGAGGAVTFTTSYDIRSGDAVTLVSLISEGGASGRGGAFALGQQRPPAAKGGAGGTARAVLEGGAALHNTRTDGRADQPSTVLQVVSQGGRGEHGGAVQSFASFATAGSEGGAGGQAEASLTGRVVAVGGNAVGVLVSSRGGAGGVGGRDDAWLNQWPGVGGRGGAGGKAVVDILAGGSVTTRADHAPAVLVESRGGAGGNGGPAASPVVLRSGVPAGHGGDVVDTAEQPSVQFRHAGTIETQGARSVAVTLQSVGGQGGEGTPNGGGGAQGGRGGAGGRVWAENTGEIFTAGRQAYGLFAQSVGGTGGRGGDGQFGFNFSGADGGAAGRGGDVSVDNQGVVSTRGDQAAGIVAQSVGGGRALGTLEVGGLTAGGGGGAGGSANPWSFLAGRGGSGGSGGQAGHVWLDQSGTVWTEGRNAIGVLAQSIGGGGGVAGDGQAVGLGFAVAIGGNGGLGGDGGQVRVGGQSGQGRIDTSGQDAIALFAQSVGGTGGNAGDASAHALSAIQGWTLAIGGSSGRGGHGGDVAVDNHSTLTTSGTQAHGLLAQSVGGGGGVAGSALASSTVVSLPVLPAIAMDYALGGLGGAGGRGGDVSVDNHADIHTHGTDAVGIMAHSVGGGGGVAGAADTITNLLGVKLNVAMTVALGGKADAGGTGGQVSVSQAGRVQTDGAFSTGLSAFSIGGGGGRAGAASTSTSVGFKQQKDIDSAVKTFALADLVKVDTRLGGQGGRGGAGGDVSVTVTGEVQTDGSNAVGVVAQSIGGGGGQAGGFSGGGSGRLSTEVSVGGRGGEGGRGGQLDVVVGPDGRVQTTAAGSHAVFAQSVGGGGGMGGAYAGAVAGEPSLSLATLMQLTKEIGAYYNAPPKMKQDMAKAEKDAKKGAPSALKTYYDIVSQFFNGFRLEAHKAAFEQGEDAERARKLVASFRASNTYMLLQALQISNRDKIKQINDDLKNQKVSVADAGITVSVGGTGGRGGEGGAVVFTGDGDIATSGDHAHGVWLQSVGGGGGAGGGAYSTGSNKVNATIAVGGRGETGGRGGDVWLDHAGTLTTDGKLSYGLLAQSVGGGGGAGGVAATADGISLAADLVVGGRASTSSPGGAVTVHQSGTISTQGDQSHAVVAQSVGGGGGTFFLTAATLPQPARATAALEDARNAAFLSLDSMFEALGVQQGGSVDINQHQTLLPSPKAALKLGGDGGGGGAGGAVQVTHSGSLYTEGDHAYGLLAQSVGGGGGLGGTTGDGQGWLTSSLSIGGQGGAGGRGGDVRLDLAGEARVETQGAGAIGVLLQSVGGGGGHAGTWALQPDQRTHLYRTYARGDVASGDGGAITVRTEAGGRVDIQTQGTRAHGLFAQSIGGGGGLVADEHGVLLRAAQQVAHQRGAVRGTGGAIDIETRGDIVATGADAHAIVAQSGVQAADGALDHQHAGGNIRISHDGILRGGSGSGAALYVDGGHRNRIVLGKGAHVSAQSGLAILGSFGGEHVENAGVVAGRVDLVGGVAAPRHGQPNHFDNQSGGWLTLYDSMTLGTSGTLRNDGVMSLGEPGAPAEVALDGHFDQGAGGQLLIDVSPSGVAGARTSDLLKVGGSVSLRGIVWSESVTALLPGRYPFLTAGGELTVGELDTPATWGPHVPVWWTVDRQDKTLALVPQADFAGVEGIALTDNQRAVAAHLQRAWDQGLEPHAGVFARFLDTDSAQAYARTLDSLSPENLQVAAVARVHASRAALTSVMSCPAFQDAGTQMREGDCVWGRVNYQHIDQDDRRDRAGYRSAATSYRLGAQRQVAPGWFVGVSAAYTHSRLRGAGGLMRAVGDSGDVAVAVKREIGAWTLAGSMAMGYGRFDNRRAVWLGRQVLQATSRSNVYTVAARLRAAYQISGDRWYVSPRVDLDVIHARKPGYTERGAGSVSLDVSSLRETLFAVRPAVEVGARIDLAGGGWVRPYANAGVTLLSEDALRTRANFIGNARDGQDFVTSSRVSRVLGDLGVGVQVRAGRQWELSAEYQAQLGRGYRSHQGTARMSMRF